MKCKRLKTFLFIIVFLFSQFTLSSFVSFIPTVNATTIFSDGFENGDVSGWTGYALTPVVITSPVHHGTYSLDCNRSAEYVYQTLSSSQATIYHRFYVRFTGLPNADAEQIEVCRGYAGATYVYSVSVRYYDATGMNWVLRYYVGTTATLIYAPSTINLNIWYCVEVYWKLGASDGAVTLYIDGASIGSATGKDTDNYGNVDTIRNGCTYASVGGDAFIIITDCVVVADAYIGPEVSGQELSFTPTANLAMASSSSSSKEQSSTFSQTVNLASSLVQAKWLGFPFSQSLAFQTGINTFTERIMGFFASINFEAIMTRIGETLTSFSVSQTLNFGGTNMLSEELGFQKTETVTFASLLLGTKALGFSSPQTFMVQDGLLPLKAQAFSLFNGVNLNAAMQRTSETLLSFSFSEIVLVEDARRLWDLDSYWIIGSGWITAFDGSSMSWNKELGFSSGPIINLNAVSSFLRACVLRFTEIVTMNGVMQTGTENLLSFSFVQTLTLNGAGLFGQELAFANPSTLNLNGLTSFLQELTLPFNEAFNINGLSLFSKELLLPYAQTLDINGLTLWNKALSFPTSQTISINGLNSLAQELGLHMSETVTFNEAATKSLEVLVTIYNFVFSEQVNLQSSLLYSTELSAVAITINAGVAVGVSAFAIAIIAMSLTVRKRRKNLKVEETE